MQLTYHLKYRLATRCKHVCMRLSETIRDNIIIIFVEMVLIIILGETRCVCETQMPPIMANSKDGLGHKDKYLSSYKKCSCAIWKLWYLLLEVMTNVNFKKNVKVKRFNTNKKVLSNGILILNIKALAFTVQKLLARLKF